MIRNEVAFTHGIMGRLDYGADLLDALTDICKDRDITLGHVEAIGAVQQARIGYYDQKTRQYQYLDLDTHLEIVSLIGNISIKDGAPMVHAHINLADSEGRAFGGHLAPGTIVFACEYIIQKFEGDPLERRLDEQTGLPLWNSCPQNDPTGDR